MKTGGPAASCLSKIHLIRHVVGILSEDSLFQKTQWRKVKQMHHLNMQISSINIAWWTSGILSEENTFEKWNTLVICKVTVEQTNAS